MITRIPFTEWVPDLGPSENFGVWEVVDALPSIGGYEPAIKIGTDKYSPLVGTPVSPGRSAVDVMGFKSFFLGTTSQLFRCSATATLTNVSGTTSYGAGSVPAWDFVQFGNDMIATSFTDPIQTMAVDGSTFSVLSAATATPKAKYIGTARNFLIAGFTNETISGTSPFRVQWSALGDPTDWVVSPTTQSDFEDLKSIGGVVQRVFGGEYAVVFQERAIQRMSYRGTPTIWQFDEVQSEIGLFAPYAAARRGNIIFFLAQDGFYMLANGSELNPIGHNKVNKWFFSQLVDEDRNKITCAIDPRSKRVYWQYPTAGGLISKVLVYDYGLDKWGHTETSLYQRPAEFLSDIHGSSLAFIKDTGATLDVALLNSTATATLQVTTGISQFAPGGNAMVRSASVIANSKSIHDTISGSIGEGSAFLTVQSFNHARAATTASTASKNETGTVRGSGRLNVRANGKFHRFLLQYASPRNTVEDTVEVQGVDVEYTPTHWR